MALTAIVGAGAGAAAQTPPQTVAESSGFTATSRLEDVTSFVRELQRLSPLVRVETLCTSVEGHTVPMLVVGKPAPVSPGDLRGDGRAVLYFQANIHGGEVEGKDALLMLVRDIVLGRTPKYLDKLVLLVVPVFNADGNERISPSNRAAQNGPDQGVGTRYNGQNLDLNRDGIKIESPEVAGARGRAEPLGPGLLPRQPHPQRVVPPGARHLGVGTQRQRRPRDPRLHVRHDVAGHRAVDADHVQDCGHPSRRLRRPARAREGVGSSRAAAALPVELRRTPQPTLGAQRAVSLRGFRDPRARRVLAVSRVPGLRPRQCRRDDVARAPTRTTAPSRAEGRPPSPARSASRGHSSRCRSC